MGVTRVKVPEEKEKPKEKKVKPVKIEKPKELKLVVRVAGTDLDGEKPLIRALKKIKGISHAMSKAICIASGFDPNIKLGSLTEKDIEKLEEVIKDPVKFGVPPALVNRRKDRATGKDLHLVGTDLDIQRKFDIQRLMDIKSYRGIRHMYGLPVRGQRTRSSFRKGRVVGVMRKVIRLQMKKEEEEKKK
jgi:small subunit ribosomal protein S13